MKDKNDVFYAALAGLLHDVGRIASRAAEQGTPASLTRNFVETYIPERWRRAIVSDLEKEADRIALADQLAAGARSEQLSIAPVQLLSIFSLVTSDGQPGRESYLPLTPFQVDERTILRTAMPDAQSAYKTMWGDFCNQAKSLMVIEKEELYLESLLLLLQRYTWCMPSSLHDIGFYDHSRMRAALAAILPISNAPEQSDQPIALLIGGDLSGVQEFIYTITNKGATSTLRGRSFYLQLLNEAVARYILRRLELPITNLIYAGGGNFYLLACPGDLEKLNREIRPEISRILYQCHQGDLYLAIDGLKLCARDFLLPLQTEQEIKRHPLSEKWNELAQKMTLAKNRRFSELGKEEFALLFKPQGHGGNEDTACKACGQEFPEKEYEKISSGGEEVKVCKSCYSYYELGKGLRKAKYLTLEYQELKAPSLLFKVDFVPRTWREALHAFGFSLPEDFEKVASTSANPQVVLALSDESYGGLQPAPHRAIGRRLLVNVAPRLTKDELEPLKQKQVEDLPDSVDEKDPPIKPFGALAVQSKGIERLGILRMDVDNLGKMFAEGLGKHASLARIASLSFAVSLYFEGWVGELAKRRNQVRRERDKERGKDDIPRGDGVYAIYSGGDDLFFVGSWDEVVELARQIRRDLERYTNHPGIHASGGIVLVNDKYPLAKAAEDCHRAEQKAKGMKWRDKDGLEKEKDVITLLGLPLPWSQFGTEDCAPETNTAHTLMHLLADEIKDDAVIRTLLNNYAKYAEAEEDLRKQGKGMTNDHRPQRLYGPWNWRVFYSLRRKLQSKEDEKLSELANHLHTTPDAMSMIGLASRWAELLLRKS
ncbi:MAG: type III-A CRISPR-associated protein Cas10/Csm1 [Chloroflexi bacterium]|nr:type III-A CRISPR-associated protein Cas10/Csm1 [Chloroflexota bacterium]